MENLNEAKYGLTPGFIGIMIPVNQPENYCLVENLKPVQQTETNNQNIIETASNQVQSQQKSIDSAGEPVNTDTIQTNWIMIFGIIVVLILTVTYLIQKK